MSDKVHSHKILRMLSKNGNLRHKNAAFRIRSITKENQTHTKEDNYGIFYRALLAAQQKKVFVLFLKIKKEDGKFTYAAINKRLVACEKIGCTIQQNF